MSCGEDNCRKPFGETSSIFYVFRSSRNPCLHLLHSFLFSKALKLLNVTVYFFLRLKLWLQSYSFRWESCLIWVILSNGNSLTEKLSLLSYPGSCSWRLFPRDPPANHCHFLLTSAQLQSMVAVPPVQWHGSDPVPGYLGLRGAGELSGFQSLYFYRLNCILLRSCSQEKEISILEKSEPLSAITSGKKEGCFGKHNNFPCETEVSKRPRLGLLLWEIPCQVQVCILYRFSLVLPGKWSDPAQDMLLIQDRVKGCYWCWVTVWKVHVDIWDFKLSWEHIHVIKENITFSRVEVFSMSHLLTFLPKFGYY